MLGIECAYKPVRALNPSTHTHKYVPSAPAYTASGGSAWESPSGGPVGGGGDGVEPWMQ